MKISLNWIKDYVKLNTENIDEINVALTDKTSEVEEVITQGEGLEKVFVGEILEIAAHPDADRMRVTQTKVGSETFQIVCGAKNIEVGQKVPVALVGAVLPGGFEIKKADKRGVESCGMICAEAEMGLAEDSEGIMVLPEDAIIGTPIIEYLGLNDTVFEVENTTITNRPDLFAHVGYAREFEAIGLGTVNENLEKILSPATPETAGKKFPLNVTIIDPAICHRMCGVHVTNFKIAPSPDWMQKRLLACDIRPINNLVDITNYVMLEMGMPLHAFDLESIDGSKVTMRVSKEGEKVTTLDGEERTLPANVILMEDEKKIFDLCGIMGGENSGVTDSTTNVWLHSPVYESVRIRRAAVALNHRTDAATIYEKRVPTGMAMPGLVRAINLMKELCPECEFTSEVLDIQNDQEISKTITLNKATVTRMLGDELDNAVITKILEDLGFTVSAQGETFEVTTPFFRLKDMDIEEDLVEEIIRVYGLKNIKLELPEITMQRSEPVKGFVQEQAAKNFLANTAFENVNFSFLGEKLLEKSGISPKGLIQVANPISEELSLMRPSLLPYLLQRIEENMRHENEFAVFEIGKAFSTQELEGDKQTSAEEKRIAFVAYNQDFYAAKSVLEGLFSELNLVAQVRPTKEAPAQAHPGQVAEVFFQGKIIGTIATLHPAIAKNFGIEKAVSWFELNFAALTNAKQKPVQYKGFNKLPSVERDQNFLVEETALMGNIIQKLSKSSKLITDVQVVDVYQGEGIEEGQKSVTLRTTYQAVDKTLTDNEVEAAHKDFVKAAEKQGAKVRG